MTTSLNRTETTRSGLRLPGDEGPVGVESAINRWEGRLFGGLVLAAFLLYGIGSAFAERPVGLALVLANSIAVFTVGAIGYRLLQNHHRRAGVTYLVARATEAVLLAGGILLVTRTDVAIAADTGYLLGMAVLSVGSLPFWLVVGRGPWLSKTFAYWGIAGYAVLAVGALIELTTGLGVTLIAAIPGGLFEITVGAHLLQRGFRTASVEAAI